MLEGNITFYNKVLNAEMQRERDKEKTKPSGKSKKNISAKAVLDCDKLLKFVKYSFCHTVTETHPWGQLAFL